MPDKKPTLRIVRPGEKPKLRTPPKPKLKRLSAAERHRKKAFDFVERACLELDEMHRELLTTRIPGYLTLAGHANALLQSFKWHPDDVAESLVEYLGATFNFIDVYERRA